MTLRHGDDPVDSASVSACRGPGETLLFYKQLIGRRLYIQSLARFLVAGAIVAAALGAKRVIGVNDLDVVSLMGLAALLSLFNVPVFLVARHHRRLERRASSYRVLTGFMHVTIDVDFVFLTAALWLVGGAKSPFQCLYLLHVIIAAAFSTPGVAYAHAAFGYTLFGGLVLGQWAGIIPIVFPVGAVNSATALDGRFVLAVLGAQGLIIALAIPLVTGLTRLLQKGEEQLRSSNTELARISRVQRDFLHIALHDLKAPVNAAVMLVQSLKIASNPPLSEQQTHWVDRAQARLRDAVAFLHDFSVLAALDAADPEREATEIDVAALVRTVVAENQDVTRERDHDLTVNIADGLPRCHGVERLIREAVANLITNANKYTPSRGTIAVRAFRQNNLLRIEVEDSGIGIAPDDQKRLFQEFIRIKTKESAVGEVTGSGLGLSIVRRVVEAHAGRVGVVSELGRGSTFYIEIPVSPKDATTAPGGSK